MMFRYSALRRFSLLLKINHMYNTFNVFTHVNTCTLQIYVQDAFNKDQKVKKNFISNDFSAKSTYTSNKLNPFERTKNPTSVSKIFGRRIYFTDVGIGRRIFFFRSVSIILKFISKFTKKNNNALRTHYQVVCHLRFTILFRGKQKRAYMLLEIADEIYTLKIKKKKNESKLISRHANLQTSHRKQFNNLESIGFHVE